MMHSAGTVISWLVEGDPAIRWQVFQDLLDFPVRKAGREQDRVGREGWGARLLQLQSPGGHWAGAYNPKWTSTTYTLLLLRALGLPASNPSARTAARLLVDEGLAADDGINFWRPRRRSSETCVTGMVLAVAARYLRGDIRAERLAQNLIAEQMPDGGWNCQRPNGATHSSLHTTISVLEGLLEYEAAGGLLSPVTAQARRRAHEFLYVHRMFRSHRSGEVIDEGMTRFSFPPQWHYDVLRGLDYLRAANASKDRRLGEAIDLVHRRRAGEGTWRLQNVHRGRYHFVMEEAGQPSRWNTLRALRVLRWWD